MLGFLKGITPKIESFGPWRQETIVELLRVCAKGGQAFKAGLQSRMIDLDGRKAQWSRCVCERLRVSGLFILPRFSKTGGQKRALCRHAASRVISVQRPKINSSCLPEKTQIVTFATSVEMLWSFTMLRL